MRFRLPEQILRLVDARNELKAHYSAVDLRFTFDGNLVGDLGEAVAADLFGLTLTGRGNEGIDGFAPDGRTVQVKASGTSRGGQFRIVKSCAEHLLFLHFDYENCSGEVVYNGPEEPVRRNLDPKKAGQQNVSSSRLRQLDKLLSDHDRLPLILRDGF